MSNIDKYRFDDAYRNVYIYDYKQQAYVYECNYLTAGITANMKESTQINKMNEYFKES